MGREANSQKIICASQPAVRWYVAPDHTRTIEKKTNGAPSLCGRALPQSASLGGTRFPVLSLAETTDTVIAMVACMNPYACLPDSIPHPAMEGTLAPIMARCHQAWTDHGTLRDYCRAAVWQGSRVCVRGIVQGGRAGTDRWQLHGLLAVCCWGEVCG
jgi:hypothetical protein